MATFIQVPPDNSGKLVETVTPLSSAHRQVFVLGDAESSKTSPVTSSGGPLVTLSNALVNVVSASSGIVQVQTTGPLEVITSGPLQVLTSGPLQVLSSGPYQVLTSGPLQTLTSGTFLVHLMASSDVFLPGTSSGGLGVTILGGASAGSTAVSITGSSGAFAPVTSSGGLAVTLLGGAAGSTGVTIFGSSGTLAVSTDSAAIQQPNGIVDLNNSSTVALGAGGVFTGTATETLLWARVVVSIKTDVPSAANGVQFQFSQDGTNWDHISAYTQPADEITTALVARLKWFRIVYTNSASTQGLFRLQTTLRATPPAGTARELSILPNSGDMAMVTQSILVGTTGTGTSFRDVKVNPSGALTADATGSVVSLSSGTVTLSSTPLAQLTSSGITQVMPVTSSGVNLYSTAGVVVDTRRQNTLQFATITVSSGGAKILVAASGSNKVKVTSYVIVASSAVNATWQSSNTVISGQMFLSSNSGVAIAGDMNSWVLETSAGGDLRLATDVTSYLTGHLAFFYEV